MNILVTMPRGATRDSFIPAHLADELAQLGHVEWNQGTENWTQEELAGRIGGMDVCITGWGSPEIDEKVLTRADRLRCIAHTGGSVAGYAAEAAYDRGVRVLSGNELYARSVAESVVAYALYELRDLGRYNREMLENGWHAPTFTNEGLLDQRVGLVGFGAVARYTAKLLRAFGCEIWIDADHVTQEEAASYGARKATLDEILSGCKVISIHLARVPETCHLINEERLRRIPEGALLINTARGSIIDEAALARELATGRFKAALDVYEQEPLPMESPLRHMDNVLLIPHMGGPTTDRRPFVTKELLHEIPKALRGEPSWLEITREMMRRMTH